MNTKNKNLINNLSEIIEYYNMNNIPKELIIKNKKDLKNKLKQGLEDIENGNVCSMEEAFKEIDAMIEDNGHL